MLTLDVHCGTIAVLRNYIKLFATCARSRDLRETLRLVPSYVS